MAVVAPSRDDRCRKKSTAVPAENIVQPLPDAVVPSGEALAAYWKGGGTCAQASRPAAAQVSAGVADSLWTVAERLATDTFRQIRLLLIVPERRRRLGASSLPGKSVALRLRGGREYMSRVQSIGRSPEVVQARRRRAPAAPREASIRRPFDPAPTRGLSRHDFRRICDNGFGDGHNSFAHSVEWFDGRLFVGTTRSNFQMVRVQTLFQDMPVHCWPVEGPENPRDLYKLDRRAQIWSYDPQAAQWEQVFVAPMVDALDAGKVARESGHRAMVVYQGASDPKPALYIASWAVSRSPGSLLLRTLDGQIFEPASDYGIIPGKNVTATRVLVPFKGRLFTSPTGTRGHDVKFVINVAGLPIIYETRDPIHAEWVPVCEPAFGDPKNLGVFTVAVFNDQLYAATFNNTGFELWRSDCDGDPPYRWVRVIEQGAYRGPENQSVAAMAVFNGALYLGTGIQNGGYDRANKIGPAGAELIRVNADDSWDLIVGKARSTPSGRKEPLSGIDAGFGNLFNGYIWSMVEHDGWLYVGTMDSVIWVEWLDLQRYPARTRKFVEGIGIENILANEAGCDLWRTADGENFLPVTRNGFDNRYNLGVRNLVSTPAGLFVGVANPFGPRVAVRGEDGSFNYVDNPRGGLEIWLGRPEGR